MECMFHVFVPEIAHCVNCKGKLRYDFCNLTKKAYYFNAHVFSTLLSQMDLNVRPFRRVAFVIGQLLVCVRPVGG